MTCPRCALPTLLLLVPLSTEAADPSYQVPVGPRALAMGSAYSAVADDATAVFWNPAGLSTLSAQEILWTHASLYDTGVTDDYVVLASPITRRLTLAGDWYHSGFDDEVLGFDENRIGLAGGFVIHPMLALGVSAKYLGRNTKLDRAQVREGSGFGMDLGFLAWALPELRAGIVIQDVFDTKIEYTNGTTVEAYPRNARVAVAYDPHSSTTLAFDVDDRYHAGGEVRPLKQLALRGGIEKDRGGEEGATYSFGVGVRVGPIRVDYAYVVPPVLDATTHLGVAVSFFPASRVQIESLEVEEVFASLARHYEHTPVARATLRNLHDRPLTATVSLDAPEIMDTPTDREVVLRPHAAREIELGAVFSPSILDVSEDRTIPMKLAVRYVAGNRDRTETKVKPGMVYAAGAIDWSRGVEQAAALVTPRDPMVESVARGAAREASLVEEASFATRNLRQVVAIFETVGLMGVSYVADPHNPYAAISGAPRAVDSVQYPRDTLVSRTGDCDDTTVLLAALFANVGIRSQLVDVPGHLFLLVEVGLHERQRLALPLDPSLLVIVDGLLWIPLETTALGKGFTAAWETGANRYSNWSTRGQVRLVDVTAAQASFAPSELPGDPPAAAAVSAGDLRDRLIAVSAAVEKWRGDHLASRFDAVTGERVIDPDALNRLAHVHYLAGRLERARDQLEQILESDSTSAVAYANLAAAYAAEGRLGEAENHLEKALAMDTTDGGVWLNLGLIRYVAGRDAGAGEAIRTGIERSGGLAPACELLRLSPPPGVRAGEVQLTEDEVLELLRAALRNVPVSGDSADSTLVEGDGRRVPSPEPRLVTAGPRAIEYDDLVARLYWKE